MSDQNKKLIIISILIITVISIFRFTGNQKNAEILATSDQGNMYETMKEEFMLGCSEGNTEWDGYCSCAYDSIVEQVGIGGLVEVGIKYEETGIFPEEIMQGILNCL